VCESLWWGATANGEEDHQVVSRGENVRIRETCLLLKKKYAEITFFS
jgi:hypothetical protein